MGEQMHKHSKTAPEETTGRQTRTGGPGHCKAETDVACRAEDIGLETFVFCLEKDPQGCEFSISFGDAFFCKSSLHISQAKASRRQTPGSGDEAD